MAYTKEAAIRIVSACADRYHSELEGKALLFITLNKHKTPGAIEFCFHGHNYLHLTGIQTLLSADRFYERCLSGRLSHSDIDFSEDGTTQLKLEILPSIINGSLSAKMIGDFSTLRPLLYTEKLAGSTRACVGFIYDKQLGQYIPNTVLKEDIRNYIRNMQRVIAVLRKPIRSELYEEITYLAKKIEWSGIEIPKQYSYLNARFRDSFTENAK